MVKKLRDRIHVHSKPDSLLEFVDADILPPRYGGSGESIDSLKGTDKNKRKNIIFFICL